MVKEKSSLVLKQKARARARARDEKVALGMYAETEPELIFQRPVDWKGFRDLVPVGTGGDKAEKVDENTSSEEGEPNDMKHVATIWSRIVLRSEQSRQGKHSTMLIEESNENKWELRPSSGKGMGMFAKISIRRGTRILADECLFHLPEPKALLVNIERAVDQLSPTQKEAYQGLACPDHPGRSPVVRTWEANCFQMGEGAGIFLTASRINHSCTPNAHFAWNANIQRETVHTTVDVSANEEITISYCHPHTDVYHRQKKLEPYGFNCKCAPCLQDTALSRASEARRRRLVDLFHKIEEVREDPRMAVGRHWLDDELQGRLEIIDLLEKENLFHIELGNQYHRAATCYEHRRKKKKALEYANKGLQIALWCVGPDSDIVEGDRARIEELEEM